MIVQGAFVNPISMIEVEYFNLPNTSRYIYIYGTDETFLQDFQEKNQFNF